MKIAGFIMVLFMLACSGNPSAIRKKLSGSDSLVITFNIPDNDSVINIVSTTEKKAIRKLSGFLNGNAAEQKDCGYDGNMIFYKNGERLLPVVFKYSSDSCRHFLFELDDQVMSTKMSNEAVNFLESLKEGRGWY